jgi:predicted transcriptional regulator
MTTKEEITERLDRLFTRLKEYPHSQAISDAIDKNLALLAELEESEQENGTMCNLY